ncbi:MAG: hypothetical protein A3F92_09445 [Candidatus Rokubacteria bacterium RIFCSPLOWO2_12_FULL_71_22]|nr:MAG: hypothetical protein A3F92_09445 [Candidatus Rokubacteria bacterium RIFCSPLOWO2_12_FULL_71_22]
MRGRFGILDAVVDSLERLLPTYRGPDGCHEGIALLCGVELPHVTLFTTAIFPAADHRHNYVRCSEEQFAAASAVARRLGLGVLAQAHTHPGDTAIHSLGDDYMVSPRYEGMLSLVVPLHGRHGLRPLDSLGVHQFQDGVWVLAERESVRQNLFIVPSMSDLR